MYFQIENNFRKYHNVKSILLQGKEKSEMPQVSIVIPTYRRAYYLQEALESALNQKNYNNYEVLVVDNEAERNTETEQLLAKYSSFEKLLYYKNEKNLGPAGNWNRCIELAKGKWINILHDDDILYPNFLNQMMKFIEENKQIELLASQIQMGSSYTAAHQLGNKKIKLKENILAKYILGNMNMFPAILFKKENAIKLGGFTEKFTPCFDYEFWIKYHLNYKSYKLSIPLGFYRFADQNDTIKVYKDIINESYNIKKALLLKMNSTNKLIKKLLLNLGMRSVIFGLETCFLAEEFENMKKKYEISTGFSYKLSKIIIKIYLQTCKIRSLEC